MKPLSSHSHRKLTSGLSEEGVAATRHFATMPKAHARGLGHTKLIICFTDRLTTNVDQGGREKK